MKYYAFCPISFKKIDENLARMNGLFTVVLLIVFLITSSIIPVLLLLFDFFIRAIEQSKWSPLAIVSRFILAKVKAKRQLIDAGPKIFAARIGLLFSVLILLAVLFNLDVTAMVLAVVFGSFAFLEAAFNYCVACKLYPYFYRLVHGSVDSNLPIKSDIEL